MKRIHLNISGFVQGVGYRAWVKRQARSLPLTGWIRNRQDGAVEVIAEGSTEKLNEFIALCRQGPPVSDVTDVTVQWSAATREFELFEVVY